MVFCSCFGVETCEMRFQHTTTHLACFFFMNERCLFSLLLLVYPTDMFLYRTQSRFLSFCFGVQFYIAYLAPFCCVELIADTSDDNLWLSACSHFNILRMNHIKERNNSSSNNKKPSKWKWSLEVPRDWSWIFSGINSMAPLFERISFYLHFRAYGLLVIFASNSF